MKIGTTPYKRCDVVKTKGRIDSQTAPQLKAAFDAIVKDGRYRIIFDLSEVDFISSTGIWVLLETQKACRRWNRGQLVLACADKNIQRTLHLAGLEHFMKTFDDLTAAVGSF